MSEQDRSQDEQSPPPQRTTFVPRWLAVLVLVALLTSGVATAWIVFAPR